MIRFGTFGWNAVIADKVTDANLSIGAGGEHRDRPIIVGNDPRFVSERFVRIYAEAATADELEVLLESGREFFSC